jgi:glycosyltransferase involved in cell wall biosynthesis
MMKILLVMFSFPPFNAIGSIRAVQLAAFLEGHGHEVRVVAGDGLPFPRALAMPDLKARIFRALFRNVEAPIVLGRKLLRRKNADVSGWQPGKRESWMVRLVGLYRAIFAMPDGQIGWYPAAMRASEHALRDWTPDVIVSSALPFTAHLVASRLARRIGKPWVAEFRDLFSGNPYSDLPSWRSAIDRKIEKTVLASAGAIVAVTPLIADELARAHGKPTFTIMNGYDVIDLDATPSPPNRIGRSLNIVYTGIIYPGRRDPLPLFEAIRRMGERGRRINVQFYGQDLRGVSDAALATNLANQVSVHGVVSYDESLRLQRQADVLLLLLWDDPRERGTITGKVFEYIGAGRPILAIGCSDGIASTLVRDRNLGKSATSPDAIADALNKWIDEIDATGVVSAPSVASRAGLSRQEQFAAYEKLLQSLAS